MFLLTFSFTLALIAFMPRHAKPPGPFSDEPGWSGHPASLRLRFY